MVSPLPTDIGKIDQLVDSEEQQENIPKYLFQHIIDITSYPKTLLFLLIISKIKTILLLTR